MSSDVPTADASHLTGSVIMTTIVETILMSKGVVGVEIILRLVTDLIFGPWKKTQTWSIHTTKIQLISCKREKAYLTTKGENGGG